MAFGERTCAQAASRAVGRVRALPGVVFTRACSTTDGRWMSVDVVVPVDDRGSKQNVARSSASRPSHSASRRSTPVDGLALGVRAVQLDVRRGARSTSIRRSSSRADIAACLPRSGSACSTRSPRSMNVLARLS